MAISLQQFLYYLLESLKNGFSHQTAIFKKQMQSFS